MSLTIGSLCSGYGGLSLAVEKFFGAETIWFAEYEDAPSRVLAHHWSTVPNLGDMTKIDWASVEPVDIIAGGTPCQDLSAAGKRQGMTEGTRSNLWVQMREAVAVIRPSIVIWENVRGAFSAYASSEVESEPGLLGVYGPDRPALRALGRVLGDLSDLGYDTEWVGVRASDAGAPHGRFRVFVLAYADRGRYEQCDQAEWVISVPDSIGDDIAADTRRLGGEYRGIAGDMVGPARASEIDREERKRHGDAASDRGSTDWGDFAVAIRRWESALGRPAPEPTETLAAKNGSRRLSPRFEEWMMGLSAGWVTDPAIGLTWRQQVKALGNGVVPQQAELALSILWPRMAAHVRSEVTT